MVVLTIRVSLWLRMLRPRVLLRATCDTSPIDPTKLPAVRDYTMPPIHLRRTVARTGASVPPSTGTPLCGIDGRKVKKNGMAM